MGRTSACVLLWAAAVVCVAQPDSTFWELRYAVRITGTGYTAPYSQLLPAATTLRVFLPKAQVRTVPDSSEAWSLTQYNTGDWWLVQDSARRIEHRQLPDLGPNPLLTATPSFRLLPFDRVRDTVAGFRCRLYEAHLDVPEYGGELLVRVWLAPLLRLNIPACADSAAVPVEVSDYELGSGCYGFYLRRELQLTALNMTIDTRCIRATPLLWNPDSADSPFALPSAYDMVPFDPYGE